MLYYIHGYLSSPQADKAILFKEKLGAIPLRYRDGNPKDLIIGNCLQRIYDAIQHDPKVVLIGSSLGGFLAAKTAYQLSNIQSLILLNPAIIPPNTNLDKYQDMPRTILEDMIDQRLFTEKIHAKITILRGTQDNVVPDDWVITFAKAQNVTIHLLDDDHRFSLNIEKLPEMISRILRS